MAYILRKRQALSYIDSINSSISKVTDQTLHSIQATWIFQMRSVSARQYDMEVKLSWQEPGASLATSKSAPVFCGVGFFYNVVQIIFLEIPPVLTP
jgi:hypothetical protein